MGVMKMSAEENPVHTLFFQSGNTIYVGFCGKER